MEIWLKQNGKKFRFAVLPESYELISESGNTRVNINALGEINLIGKRKLKSVSFSSFFPKQTYYFCQYKSFPSPNESVRTIENMQKQGNMVIVMSGTPINMNCTIESFVWGEEDGTGDIYFTLELAEYIKPKAKVIEKIETVGETIQPAETERISPPQENTTYTVVKGDNLSKIAKKTTGSSVNWNAIYKQNTGVIGSDPNKIYPGQVLAITI